MKLDAIVWWMLVAAAMIVITLLAVTSGALPVRAAQCHARPAGSGWAWREIDGRRCWYRGSRGMAKHRLSWPARNETKKFNPNPYGDPSWAQGDER